MHRLLTPADYRSMPWKNGGGRTTEIAISPPGAALDAFAWRVSVADVERDGAFSRFPGVDRTIVLLAGEGMRLTGATGEILLRTSYAPHSFSGDEAIDCALVGGPVRDFNAMFRRGRARGTVTSVRGSRAVVAPARVRLAYVAAGAYEITMPDCPAARVATGCSMVVEPSAGSEAGPFEVKPLSGDAVALVVSIDCR